MPLQLVQIDPEEGKPNPAVRTLVPQWATPLSKKVKQTASRGTCCRAYHSVRCELERSPPFSSFPISWRLRRRRGHGNYPHKASKNKENPPFTRKPQRGVEREKEKEGKRVGNASTRQNMLNLASNRELQACLGK